MKYKKSLFIFRRDLRLEDNTGLNKALEVSEQVICAFIFDKRQIENHPFKSLNGLEFLYNSLIELNDSLKEKSSRLYVWEGLPNIIVEQLINTEKIEAVFLNKDYTPFSIKRDQEILETCEKFSVNFESYSDALLTTVGSVLKSDGKPYTIYTPFYKAASKLPTRLSTKLSKNNFYKNDIHSAITTEQAKIGLIHNPNLHVKGGRKEALKILSHIKDFYNYDEKRNLPAVSGTTNLSAHLKFGVISAREVFKLVEENFGVTHTLIKELYWRDFFTTIGFYFPHVYTGSFHKKYDQIKWENNTEFFELWKNGKTGFPIVDAGMRQLNETGFMHNRVRMIVASFLTKDLLIDWHWGEKYFAQKLVDYDPAVNNGNWQWAASTGCDAQPYFRIFNPWLQQERFDPECLYIKKWLPELNSLTAKAIHALKDSNGYLSYPAPIVQHSERKGLAEDLYRDC
jgi:deoxyribodipyrimidine photo-lyase